MKEENLTRAKKCIDRIVDVCNKTNLSVSEKHYMLPKSEIWGAAYMALQFLDFEAYIALKQYIYDKYGYDLGGARSIHNEG